MGDTFLESLPLEEALRRWIERLSKEGKFDFLPSESIKVIDSLGRVTAEPVIAKISSPFFTSSAMDGYAVKFVDTFGASERSPKKLKIGEQAVYVDTGDPLPDGFNAVIMIEDVNIIGKNEYIEIITPATPWQHVRVVGEDIVATDLIIPENQRIRPVDIGAMLAGGITEIKVRKKPRVTIIPTGNEIVEPGTELKKGDIIEYNSRILGSLVLEWGGEYLRYEIVRDNLQYIKRAILKAHEISDLIVVNAGASSGSEDFTAKAIKELGEVILHGVNIKPGKPIILGWVNGKPVLGVPGYPVSAFITFNLFAKILIYKWQGLDLKRPENLKAKISRRFHLRWGRRNF